MISAVHELFPQPWCLVFAFLCCAALGNVFLMLGASRLLPHKWFWQVPVMVGGFLLHWASLVATLMLLTDAYPPRLSFSTAAAAVAAFSIVALVVFVICEPAVSPKETSAEEGTPC